MILHVTRTAPFQASCSMLDFPLELSYRGPVPPNPGPSGGRALISGRPSRKSPLNRPSDVLIIDVRILDEGHPRSSGMPARTGYTCRRWLKNRAKWPRPQASSPALCRRQLRQFSWHRLQELLAQRRQGILRIRESGQPDRATRQQLLANLAGRARQRRDDRNITTSTAAEGPLQRELLIPRPQKW